MSSIDKRTVEMQFNNSQFEKGIQTSISSLDKLKQALHLDDAANTVNKALSKINGVNLSAITEGVAALERRFSALGIAGMEVIRNITNGIIGLASNIKNITWNKVFQGGKNRAMNIEQARFMLKGLIDDQKEISRIESDAMKSVNDTAYTFDSAAKAAAQFAATGMRSGEQMQHALNGITGAAAMTNSEYDDMARIFTTVAGNGKLMGDQLIQFSSRGMNVAANMKDYFNAVNSGAKDATESVKEAITTLTGGKQITEGEFREFVSKGEISFEMFAESMYQLYGEHAKKANETLSGVIANTGSALSKMGQLFYLPIIKQNGPLVKFFDTLKSRIYDIRKFLDPIVENVSTNLVRVIKGATRILKSIDLKDAKDSWIITRNINRTVDALFSYGRGLENILNIYDEIKKKYKGSSPFPKIDVDKSFEGFKAGAAAFEELTKSEKNVKRIAEVFKGFLSVINMIKNAFYALKTAISPVTDLLSNFARSVFGEIQSLGSWLYEIDEFVGNGLYEWANKTKETLKLFLEGNEYFNLFSTHLKTVYDGFKNFAKSTKTVENLKNIFNGFKSAISLLAKGFTAVSIALSPLVNLFKEFAESIFYGIGAFGEWITGVNKTVGESKSLYKWAENFRDNLQKVIDNVKDFFSTNKKFLEFCDIVKNSLINVGGGALYLAQKFGELIKVDVKTFFSDLFDNAKDADGMFHPLKALFDFISKVGTSLWKQIKKLGGIFKPFGDLFFNTFGKIFDYIVGFFSSNSIKDVLAVVNGGFITLIGKRLSTLAGIASKFATGKITLAQWLGLTGPLTAIKDAFIGMQKELNAKMLEHLAVAILGIAVAVMMLASLDMDQITTASIGIGIIASALSLMLEMVDIITSKNAIKDAKGPWKALERSMQFTDIIKLSAAILIMSKAVENLGKMDKDQVIQGLVAMSIILTELTVVCKVLMTNSSYLSNSSMTSIITRSSASFSGIISLSVSLLIVSKAIEKMGSLDTSTLIKGITAMTIILTELTVMLKVLQNKSSLFTGNDFTALATSKNGGLGSVLILAVSLLIVGKSVAKLGSLDNATLIKGIGAMTVILGSIAVFNKFQSKTVNAMAIAASVLIVANALLIMAASLRIIGTMKLDQVENSVLSLGIMIGTIALAIYALSTMGPMTLVASASMLLVAQSMLIMSVALAAVGALPMKVITGGLFALAGAIGIFMASALLLTTAPQLITGLLSLSATLLAFGAAVALVGVGIALFAVGFATLAVSGVAGATALVSMIGIILSAIPMIMIIAAEVLGSIINFLKVLIVSVCDLIIESAPKIGEAVIQLIIIALAILVAHVAEIVDWIGVLIIGIIEGVADFIIEHGDDLREAIKELIVNLLYFAAETFLGLIDWVWGLICEFFKGLWEKILGFFGVHSPSTLFADLGKNLMLGLVEGIKAFAGLVLDVITGLISEIVGLFSGLIEKSGQVGEAIYDALHPNSNGKAQDKANELIYQKAAELHKAGQKASDIDMTQNGAAQVQAAMRQLERVEENGYDLSGQAKWIQDYYAKYPEEAKKAYDEAGDVAKDAAKHNAEIYGNTYLQKDAELKAKALEQEKAVAEYRENAAKESGSRDASVYSSNHYAEIEKSKSQNTKAAQDYYDPYTDIAKKYGLDSGMLYDVNTSSGMDKYSNLVDTSGINLGKTASKGAKSQKNEFINAGAQYDLGLAQGIQNSGAQGAVVAAVKNLASRMVREMKKTLDEHSPSRVSEEIGEYFVLGLRNGIRDTESVAINAADNLGSNIIANMTDSLSSTDVESKFNAIQDAMYKVAAFRDSDLNVHPTITPVMSLDNIQNGMSTIDQMFSAQRSIDLSAQAYSQWGDQNSMNSMLDSMNSNNVKVVQAISEIRGDISKLENSMAKMRIFLDSGALVGGIITDVDNYLGNIAFMKRRTGGGL